MQPPISPAYAIFNAAESQEETNGVSNRKRASESPCVNNKVYIGCSVNQDVPMFWIQVIPTEVTDGADRVPTKREKENSRERGLE